MELPTKTTQKSGFLARLLKKWKDMATSNDTAARMQRSTGPEGQRPDESHAPRFCLPAWLHPLRPPCPAHTCASAPGSFLSSSVEDITEEVVFEQDTAVELFYFTKKNLSKFYTPLRIQPPIPRPVGRTARGVCRLCSGIKTARAPIQSLSFT